MEAMLEDCMPVSLENKLVLSYIESTFDQIISRIRTRHLGTPEIILHRVLSAHHAPDPINQNMVWHIKSYKVTYGWPGSTKYEAWRFACLSRILVEVYSAIKAGITVTKRDIYYRDPTLFKRQEVVDRFIDDIAFTCKVTRKDLNVVCDRSLFVAGLDNSNDANVLADNTEVRIENDCGHVKWILVVEKEAVFKLLVEKNLHVTHAMGRGVIMTGKGYPDLATRRYLRALIDAIPQPTPVFGLFDADPDGLEIFRCYSQGSKVLVQEPGCVVPEMKWIGLSLSDVVGLGASDCMSLTGRDRTKAQAMLTRLAQADVSNSVLGQELRMMLALNVKAEVEALEGRIDIVSWLERRMTPV